LLPQTSKRKQANTNTNTTMASNRSGRLAEAAEELAKAALAEADSSSLAVGREAVAGLKQLSSYSAAMKESIDHKLNTNNQKLDEVKHKLDTVNESMTAAVAKVGQELKELKDAIKQQDKFQRINYAIENFRDGCFIYTSFSRESKDYTGKQMKEYVYFGQSKSSDFVKTALLLFRKGNGSYLPRAILSGHYSTRAESLSESDAEERELAFRNSVVDHIFSITGTKPSITQATDGRYIIWYS
jgi:hypothetical protein